MTPTPKNSYTICTLLYRTITAPAATSANAGNPR
jgi:hypothetical protein